MMLFSKKNHPNKLVLLGMLFLLPFFSFSQEEKVNEEEIIVFIQSSKESDFTTKEIFKLEAFVKELNIPIKVIDIEIKGAPEEVKYTPFIVYQNYLGRKIYKGRYTTFNRLKNFITTVQFIPSDAGEYIVSNALVFKEGRSEFFVQSKITPLGGEIPQGFNPAEFMNEAWAGIKKGMKEFDFYNHKNFLLANEIFYLNYYPYMSDDGMLYVSYELYSHYDCVAPIYQQIEVPIKASAAATRRAFYLAAKSMKEEMVRLWKESEMGDAISTVSSETKTSTWEQLGFVIPPPPSKEKRKEINANAFRFSKKWEYTSAYSEDKPALQFYFPPPIHQYSGSVKDIQGNIYFDHPDSFLVSKMQGEFQVRTPSLSMGLADLDKAVHEKMLRVKEFPSSKFKIINVRARKGAVIEIGKPTYTQIEAEFTLMGRTFNVKAPTQFEPYINKDGNLFIHVTSSFKIENLAESYEIEGPPGPAKSSNNIIVKIDILLEPKT